MIQKESYIDIVDNTNGIIGRCIGLYKKKVVGIGGYMKISARKVKYINPLKPTNIKNICSQGKKYYSMVVRINRTIHRKDGDMLCFNSNGCILVSIEKSSVNLLGTRVRCIVPYELRLISPKIVSLSKSVV